MSLIIFLDLFFRQKCQQSLARCREIGGEPLSDGGREFDALRAFNHFKINHMRSVQDGKIDSFSILR